MLTSPSDRVKVLSNVLRDLKDISPQQIPTDKQGTCHESIQVCNNVLSDLEKLIGEYIDLDSTSGGYGKKFRRVHKRLRWKPDDMEELRSRMTSTIGLLNTNIGTHCR